MIVEGYDEDENPLDLKVLAEDWYLIEKGIKYETLYCDPITFSQSWPGYKRYSDRRGANCLIATLDSFEVDYMECGDSEFLNYYYQISHDPVAGEIIVNTVMCCGDDAVWPEDFVAHGGYDAARSGAAFEDFEDQEDENISVKQIIVYCACGVVMIFCCIAGIIFYKKCVKERELEVGT